MVSRHKITVEHSETGRTNVYTPTSYRFHNGWLELVDDNDTSCHKVIIPSSPQLIVTIDTRYEAYDEAPDLPEPGA